MNGFLMAFMLISLGTHLEASQDPTYQAGVQLLLCFSQGVQPKFEKRNWKVGEAREK
jgi:hypothetical protein